MNSVQLEILKIDKQWYNEIKKNLHIPLFVCLGEKHELNLFDTYFKYQGSQETSTQDIFLVHYQEFTDPKTYGQSLIDEWKEAYLAWQKSSVSVPDWEEEEKQSGQTDAYKAIKALKNLCKISPTLNELKIFVHLAPINLKPELAEAFGFWLQEWCQSAGENIKLVITDHHTFRSYKNLPSRKSEFRIQIDIHQLMQNAAEQTNRDKGSIETNFQQQILIASNYLSQGKNKEALTTLEKGARIAKQQRLPEAEATARLMIAQTYNVIGETKEAHVQFQKTLQIAGNNSFLGVQMYMNYGGYLLSQSKTTEAIDCFEKAADIGKKLQNHFIQLECTRVIGQLKERKFSSQSIPYYEKCIQIAKEMSSDMRRQSSLSYTAGLLMKKYGNNSKRGKKLNQDMLSMVGEDWELLAVSPKNIKTN